MRGKISTWEGYRNTLHLYAQEIKAKQVKILFTADRKRRHAHTETSTSVSSAFRTALQPVTEPNVFGRWQQQVAAGKNPLHWSGYVVTQVGSTWKTHSKLFRMPARELLKLLACSYKKILWNLWALHWLTRGRRRKVNLWMENCSE